MSALSIGNSDPHLFECFDCHRTWKERAMMAKPCPVCDSQNVIQYTNERTAALEAAGIE